MNETIQATHSPGTATSSASSLPSGANQSGSTVQGASERLLSLDAYRGLIMVALAFRGFGLADTASLQLKDKPDSSFWQHVKFQFSHAEWVGGGFWDMIQPSFMFMVGVSMAYSYVKRQSRGDSWAQMFAHASIRAIVLVLLGVFLSSQGASQTNWAFMNVLSQIGLGYIFLFMMWGRHLAVQLGTVVLLLLGTGLAYTSYPTSGIDLETGNKEVGIEAQWAQANLTGVPAAWHKNANIGQAADLMLLNLFPRPHATAEEIKSGSPEVKLFTFNSGGYQTINFIPSLATMILGLICGELLRCNWAGTRKVLTLLVMGGLLIVLGQVGHAYGWPIVKRIWTPTWAVYSTGICCLILAALYGIIDVGGMRAWSMFLVVVGMNSIAIYMMSQLLHNWTARQLKQHFGESIFTFLGKTYEPMLLAIGVGSVFWLTCYWMMRQKIFIRI